MTLFYSFLSRESYIVILVLGQGRGHDYTILSTNLTLLACYGALRLHSHVVIKIFGCSAYKYANDSVLPKKRIKYLNADFN